MFVFLLLCLGISMMIAMAMAIIFVCTSLVIMWVISIFIAIVAKFE